MKLGQTHGALIGDIDPKGPASHAGLQPGDIITEANNKGIDDQRELRLMISGMAPGSQLNLRVMHDGQSRPVTLTLAEMPAKETVKATPEQSARQKPSAPDSGQPHLGVAVGDLSPEIIQRLGVPSGTKGVIIADVQDGSAAAEAGLQAGDIIQEVDRKPVHNVAEFRTVMSSHGSGPVLFLINREGHNLYAAVERR
jgi:serine protease Do